MMEAGTFNRFLEQHTELVRIISNLNLLRVDAGDLEAYWLIANSINIQVFLLQQTEGHVRDSAKSTLLALIMNL